MITNTMKSVVVIFCLAKKLLIQVITFQNLMISRGWATWKRAWKFFDIDMKTFPQFKEQDQLKNYIDDAKIREWLMSYFEQDFNAVGSRQGLWSSQWAYAICVQSGLTVVPSVNLVVHIGFSDEATT